LASAREGEGAVLTSEDEARTIEIGRIVGELVRPGDAVLLIGELGAGKTRFVQGMTEGIRAPGGARSPTFVLVNEYEGRLRLLHSDLYRIAVQAEVEDLGLTERLEAGDVLVVEWADRAPQVLPADALTVRFETRPGFDVRRLNLSAGGPRSSRLLREVLEAVARGEVRATG
jgi:tRNA threonylcarbamoyladenosine biosynthesis protein TsaE